MVEITIVLAVLGLCAGSFINAVVWRLHEQSKGKKTTGLSIMNGRSMCEHCKHTLAWYDLIPLASWLSLNGKCRYCHKPIAWESPLVEVVMAAVFVVSYLLWPFTVHQNGQWLLLAAWLVSSVGLAALAVYDLKWMLLPNRIIYPTLVAAVAGRAVYTLAYSHRFWHALLLWAGSLVIASGVFFALFVFSKGKWIGFGDVRLGLITGTLLADPEKSLAMLFLASVIGTLVIVPALTKGNKNLGSKLPYGPFLIAGTFVIILFGDSLLNWYKGLIL